MHPARVVSPAENAVKNHRYFVLYAREKSVIYAYRANRRAVKDI